MTTVVVTKNTVPDILGKQMDFVINRTAVIYAEEQKRVTKNLTKSAFGADGKPMPSLTKRYKKLKMKAGGKGIRDLRGTGGLMKSLEVKVIAGVKSSRELSFGEQYEKIVEGNQAHAEFFGIHPTALRFGEQEVVKQFNALR